MTLGEGRNGLALLDADSPLRLLLIADASVHDDLGLAMVDGQFARTEIQREATLEGAIARLADQRFDLVLADLSLPDASGAAVVRAVRGAAPEAALMVLTDGRGGDLAARVLADGAHDYLVKGRYDWSCLDTVLGRSLQRQRSEVEAHRYLNLARGLLDAVESPTCAIDSESTIVAVNRAWRDRADQKGGADARVGVGVSFLDHCDRLTETSEGLGADEAAVMAHGVREVLAGSVERFSHDFPYPGVEKDRWLSIRVTPVIINDRRGAILTYLDITDQRALQKLVSYQSLHDPLTDLPNGVLMLGLLQQAVRDADQRGAVFAVTHLGFDDLQRVNDRIGYRGGDAVLVQVAERLRAQLRPGDTLARLSGDGFVVIWRGSDGTTPAEAVKRSGDLVRAMQRPFEVEPASAPISVSASAGVAPYTSGLGSEQLLESAATAFQEAKSQGPGHVVLFTDELQETTLVRKNLELELRSALEGPIDQFVLHYQPIMDLTSGKVVAVEALVRWQHPARGLVGPDQIIPIAEATGLIHPLGDWVLNRAIQDAADLSYNGREFDIAVNVSVLQLDDRAVSKVERALESSGLRPDRLILEVTESAIVEDEETTAATLDALSRLGVKIAIDDFGTGYSSLLYLRRYPISTVKIDREFVDGIGRRIDDEAICGSITSLAAAVGASTVGEGVETVEQYSILRTLGCRQGQGFLWSPAVALHQLEAAFAACERVPVPVPGRRMLQVPEGLPSVAKEIIAEMHAEGASVHTIAGALNRKVGLNPRGVRWTASSVSAALPVDGPPTASTAPAVDLGYALRSVVSSPRDVLLYDGDRDAG